MENAREVAPIGKLFRMRQPAPKGARGQKHRAGISVRTIACRDDFYFITLEFAVQ